jgi:hypothetical protein
MWIGISVKIMCSWRLARLGTHAWHGTVPYEGRMTLISGGNGWGIAVQYSCTFTCEAFRRYYCRHSLLQSVYHCASALCFVDGWLGALLFARTCAKAKWPTRIKCLASQKSRRQIYRVCNAGFTVARESEGRGCCVFTCVPHCKRKYRGNRKEALFC